MTTFVDCHDASALAEALAQRCDQAHQRGETWVARCPAHDDHTPSLHITPKDDKVVLHCFAHCTAEAVVQALGLTMADLFVQQRSPNGHRRILKVYDYFDAHGTLLHQTLRYDDPNHRFGQRRPHPTRPGEYIWKEVFKDIEPVLYNLPAVLAAITHGDTIHLAEGEKDADTIIALGLVATTVPMGAKYWRDSYTTMLTDTDVVVWPDNDEAGQARISKVQRALTGKAKTLRIVPVPAPHKDVSDWIHAGGTRAEIEALIQAHTTPAPLKASLVSFAELMQLQLPQRDAYMDWLAERSLNMMYGPRGVGKTMVLLGVSISLATGRVFLKWPIHQAVGVLYVDGEMSLDELRTRAVTLAGGDIPTRMTFLPSELVYTRSGRDLTLTCEQNRRDIEAMLDEHPGIKVIVLDNVSCLFPGISEDKKQDWEPINAWLIRLRHRGITVMLGHHAGKNGQQRGTSGREDALDTIIALTYPPGHQAQDGCHFHLHFEKSRGVKGETVEALDVRLDETPEGLGWTHASLETTRTERVKALLADGMPAKLIAEELAIDPSYVYRLKRKLGL
jgi:putative DNA primase/helicase